ncbi:hypothetical protein [Marinisporobacter balticus]|uniref:Uncharacterized protein n=1 Tax=Marinisporobacter balticus TaxID=2018667 RepID=A0A4V2S9F2_9FIRM|nr:hypothetical protein [Marinisporobacter balticus]TCO67710.1 hypothetical protein EV214_1614 [Marinisporobacter balticus]
MIRIKWRTIIVTTILIVIFGIVMLRIFSLKPFANNIKNIRQDISKEQIINWIKVQGKNERYYYEGLSYELVNLDNDPELEVVAKIVGGVHLGQFFIFDKRQDERYHLITEQDWKIESWNLSNPIANHVEVGNKKIFEIVTRTGGTGIDIYKVYLWYIEQGKFIEAWQGILKDRSSFRDDYLFKIGNYQFNDENDRIYAWLSSYKYQSDGVTLKEKFGTNTMIYKFDGTHFVLDTETGFTKTN